MGVAEVGEKKKKNKDGTSWFNLQDLFSVPVNTDVRAGRVGAFSLSACLLHADTVRIAACVP